MNSIVIFFSFLFFQVNIMAQEDLPVKVDFIFKSFDKINSPGLSVAVIKNGTAIYNKGFGLSNLEYDVRNTDTSVFDIASIAKQFTAASIWTLVEKCKISLDDDVRKYLPELPILGDTIKIRHMLNHTSGLRNYSSLKELAGEDYTKEFFNNDSVFKLMCEQRGLNNKPGEKVLYGNSPYNLLTIIIERISGVSFNEYAVENLFKPLGMKNTYYRIDNTSIVKNRAVGYLGDEKSGYSQFSRIESCYGAGSLWSTVEDLIVWTNLLTRPTEDYKPLVDFLITKDTLNSGELSSYSRGVMVDEYKNQTTIHHSGMTKGYRSQIISLPEIELSVIILANMQAIDPVSLSYKVIDLFIPEILKALGKNSYYTHTKVELEDFVGDYQELNSSLKMKIVLDTDTLKAKSSLGNDYISLISEDENTLRRPDNESVKYVFANENQPYDLIVYFGATPFYFEQIELIDQEKIINSDYVEEYYSQELDVSYTISEVQQALFLSYPNNSKIRLVPGAQDEFGNGYRTKYSFSRDENRNVTKLLVASEGTVKDIEFIKKPGSHVL